MEKSVLVGNAVMRTRIKTINVVRTPCAPNFYIDGVMQKRSKIRLGFIVRGDILQSRSLLFLSEIGNEFRNQALNRIVILSIL